MALALPGAQQSGHFEVVDFRVRNKIFATLPDDERMVLRLTPEEQAAVVAADPGTYSPTPGRYGELGWTYVVLASADAGELRELVTEAWRRLAPKRVAAAYDAG
jgi:hypothetical protein